MHRLFRDRPLPSFPARLRPTLAALRAASLRAASSRAAPAGRAPVELGAPGVDRALAGGLARGALHEVFAAGTADLAAATGFVLALAFRAAGGRPIVWARHDAGAREAGAPHAPGLAELGLDPGAVLLVSARDAVGALKAGADAARCPALGAVVIEPWGEVAGLDRVAGRRLSLAAETSGVVALLLRADAAPRPSAAATRWRVRARPSRALAANAPGAPRFALELLRHRGGAAGRQWVLEWDREHGCFSERNEADAGAAGADAALSRPVVSVPAGRADSAGERDRGRDDGRRRAG